MCHSILQLERMELLKFGPEVECCGQLSPKTVCHLCLLHSTMHPLPMTIIILSSTCIRFTCVFHCLEPRFRSSSFYLWETTDHQTHSTKCQTKPGILQFVILKCSHLHHGVRSKLICNIQMKLVTFPVESSWCFDSESGLESCEQLAFVWWRRLQV